MRNFFVRGFAFTGLVSAAYALGTRIFTNDEVAMPAIVALGCIALAFVAFLLPNTRPKNAYTR